MHTVKIIMTITGKIWDAWAECIFQKTVFVCLRNDGSYRHILYLNTVPVDLISVGLTQAHSNKFILNSNVTSESRRYQLKQMEGPFFADVTVWKNLLAVLIYWSPSIYYNDPDLFWIVSKFAYRLLSLVSVIVDCRSVLTSFSWLKLRSLSQDVIGRFRAISKSVRKFGNCREL